MAPEEIKAIVNEYMIETYQRFDFVCERAEGLLVAVELKEPMGKEVKMACLDRKLMVTDIGTMVIRMLPSLILNEEHCDEVYNIVKESILEVMEKAKV